MKKQNKKSLKKKAWNLCSLWIRNKYAVEGFVKCVTCGITKPIKMMQAGHFVPGRSNAVLFEEHNIHPQCVQCNVFKKGNIIEYFPFMLKKYGRKEVNRLLALKDKEKKLTEQDLIKLINFYKIKLRRLL